MHQRFQVEASDKLIPVGQVQMPETFTAHLTEDDAGGPDVALRFEIREEGTPECRELRVTSTKDGHEVRYSGIVGVRVDDVLERALRHMLVGSGTPSAEGLHRWYDRLSPEAVHESRKARAARKVTVTDAVLREVAEVYRANIGNQPTAAVAEHFAVAHRTAALRVQRARRAGLLPPTTRGKAKA
jgi:hypothetical protein